ncbi:hypothetical protein MAPG_07657 [Magnaporthiopsis poae ATCC 64411]|uniref:Enoyl reductase (ER) domain-containing protein n=1 Tax=Magnaporthiopsis poae (strain ATCC 64411 / 73-15) TaxID=644358 RepID=A0A0C4E591_MAGP6|nr:hypothetical protein MAPG_07657 [Magnaporthiopsis poae ATCC 64411]
MSTSPEIPSTMRALATSKHCKPDNYEIQTLPVPKIVRPEDCLVRVHAAASTAGEAQAAAGAFRYLMPTKFPWVLGMEGSGVVVAVGSGVKSLKVGDEVMGGRFTKPVFPNVYDGWIAEYAVAPESLLVRKPRNISFEDAACLTGSTVTAYQCFKRGVVELMRLPAGPGASPLEGKTVFVPGALSATGGIGVQMAKNVFGASKVISTVSTPKLPVVERHLGPGIVDQLIDYKTQDVAKEVGMGTVDFVYNTQWGLEGTFPLLKPKTGVVVSIASIPPPDVMRGTLGKMPLVVTVILTIVQWWYDWKTRGTNIQRLFVSGNPACREDCEECVELVARGKIKAVKTVVSFGDLTAMRSELSKVYSGKGGLGALVVKIV